MVQGPAARICRLSVSSWGADVSVKGWYSVVPRARQAIRTHCPDLYSKPWGRWNSRWVTPEEGRWTVAHCSESGNWGPPRVSPPATSALLLEYDKGGIPSSEVTTPPGHVYPEQGLGSTGAGAQQDKEWPGPGSSSLWCERSLGPLAKSLLYSLPHPYHLKGPANSTGPGFVLPCQHPQNHQPAPPTASRLIPEGSSSAFTTLISTFFRLRLTSLSPI